MSSDKIRPDHLQRTAFVYIRQSSLSQVRQHHESRRRQYDLADHARRLGWSRVIVIDEDLGKSGATAVGRTGFQRLVAEVSLGHAGAIVGLEVSRLARNNRDWYQLLDLCGLTNTLIIDADGVYDPRQLNDRLLLGLKGTMSEAELGWIRQRAYEAVLAKARRGALVVALPVGYVRTPDERVEKHPDQRVQHAIELVFQKFAETGSVRQTLLWFRQEQVALPAREGGATEARFGVGWRLPVYNTILKFLTHPCYAGAFTFGRTGQRTTVVDGVPHITRGHRRPREEWIALVREHHEPYIAWEVYERNRAMIAHNAQTKGLLVRGAVRRGPSLLAGLLRCGHCGRRLHVAYSGFKSAAPRYHCVGAATNHGTGTCIGFGSLRVDAAIDQEVLRVLAPGAIEAAMTAAATASTQQAAGQQALELELREARYEAERARRQYDAVEPEHRLVAETLERRWNSALERVRAVEARLPTVTAAGQPAAAIDAARLRALAEEFPRVWTAAATDHRTKKRIVRLLIEEIVVQLVAAPEPQIQLVIHWKGGKHTQLRVPRNRHGRHRRCTDRAIIDVARELARTLPDGGIARVLNRLGYRTGAGNSWTQQRVAGLRNTHGIPPFDRTSDRASLLTIEQAAGRLGVSAMTVRKMIRRGLLPATQPVVHAPWAIREEDLAQENVQRAVEAVKRGGTLPPRGEAGQLTLEESGT